MNGSMEKDDLYYWKRKYESKNQQYLKLKEIARLAGKEFDDFVIKYQLNLKEHNKFKAEYAEMVKQIKEKDEELEKMESCVRPFVTEFETMKDNYNSEITFREKAEELASSFYHEKVHFEKQNKRLKRQSEHILGLMKSIPNVKIEEILLESDDSDRESCVNEACEDNLNADKSNLTDLFRDEVETWRKKFEENDAAKCQVTIELEQMRQKFHSVQNSLSDMKKRNINAENELRQLQERYDRICEQNTIIIDELQLKNKLQEKTEEYASKCHFEAEAMKRQSSAMMCGVEAQQLDEAMEEIAKLRAELAQQDLEAHNRSDQCKDRLIIEQLQNNVDELKKKLEDASKLAEDYNYKNRVLHEELDMARKISQTASSIPLPPPPPPPPPPQKFSNIFALIGGNKQKKIGNTDTSTKPTPTSGKKDEDVSNLMKEMMDRITSGQHLKKSGVRTLAPPKAESNVVNELSALLAKRKKGSEEEITAQEHLVDTSHLKAIKEEKSESVEVSNTNDINDEKFEPQLRRPSLAPPVKKKPEVKCATQEL